MSTNKEQLKIFGFIEGVTTCNRCNKILSKNDAYWAMGHWWCRFVKSCDKQKQHCKE